MFLALSSSQIMTIVWIVFIVATVIIELETTDLVTVWFTLGAVGALIAAICGAELWLQIVLFVGIGILALICTRPLAKRMQQKEIIRTNSDKIVGEYGIVTKKIVPNEIGEIKIESRYWRAISKSNDTFEVDEKVLIEAITGSKVIVSKIEDKKEEVIL